jgi:FtsZ-binding cell division protein ZapB
LAQLQSDKKHGPADKNMSTRSFHHLWIGIFFIVSSVSLIIVMSMFIFVWQPIWTEGFKDFHTISNAIDKLDKTAQPASDTIPLMLAEMVKMNKSMNGMQNIMREMNGSMENIEQMTPDIKRMNKKNDPLC